MTTTAAVTTIKVGDKVIVDHPKYTGQWIVKSIARVNATLEPVNGGRGLRAPMTMLMPAPAAGEVTITEVPIPKITFFNEGEVVTVKHGKFADGYYVVISDKGADRVNIARLGGDNGRYVRISRAGITKVNVADILK